MTIRTMKDPATYLEAGAFAAAALTMKALPLKCASHVGYLAAKIFGVLSHRGPAFIESQMRTTFGNRYNDSEYRQLVRAFFKHQGSLFAEGVRLKSLTKENMPQHVDWSERLPDLLKLIETSETGVFFVTGHIGNWEMTGAASTLKGLLVGSIARPLDNPIIDKLVLEYRQSSGQKIWEKQGALKNILRAIRKKQSVGILVDQDAGEQGMSIPFLGRPSSTNVAIADLAIRTGAPLVPAAMQRMGEPMKFRANIGEFIIPDKSADPKEERKRILTRMNEELGKIIMAAPEQWLWTHRRWKTPNPVDTLE